MAPPIIRDVAHRLTRSGAAGNDQVPLQEAHITCWTGRFGGPADNCALLAEYGETPAYGQNTVAAGPLSFHRVILTGLLPGRRYHFRLHATGSPGTPSAGETATSQDFAFTNTPGRLPGE